MKKAILLLQDGKCFEGKALAEVPDTFGEVVFNTSMTGYQEILTDPSYKGQIVTMTYPLIGNYGANPVDVESKKPMVEGFIVRELCEIPSNYRSKETLFSYLERHKIPLVTDMDTRAITIYTRSRGAMSGVISTSCFDLNVLQKKLDQYPGLVERDLVRDVTCNSQYVWSGDGVRSSEEEDLFEPLLEKKPFKNFKVVALDFGIKYNMPRILSRLGCEVVIVPANATIEEIDALKPDGIFLSNGPGDPEPVYYAIETIRKMIGKYPIFGICLGQQLLGLALGAKTYKLKFGHRGANHPIKNLLTNKIEITCQNHGFAIDQDTLPNCLELTHINLNDHTVAGFRHKKFPVYAVQYHPESSAGPHDSRNLFAQFIELMRLHHKERNTSKGA